MLAKEFYGNTISQWLIAAGVILGAYIFTRMVYWFFKNIVKKLTSKSESKLDDILIDKIEEPVAFAITLFGIWYALRRVLNFSAEVYDGIDKGFYFLVILNIAWLVARLVDAIIEQYLVPMTKKSESDMDDQILPILRKGIRIVIWLVGIIVGLNNAGFDLGAVLASLGIGGLAFALAAQDTVSNLFGGFTIFTDKPFTVNDRVEVNGYDGVVEEIGIRSIRLRTLSGRLVTIPNSKVAHNAITNISSEPTRKVVLNLGLTYDMDHEKVQKGLDLLKEISERHSDLIEDNTVRSFNAFGDFALNIIFIYYIKKSSDIMDTQTVMNMDILKTFAENGLDFAFPTQTILHQQVN